MMDPMRAFDELLAEAESVDVTGWDFSWLDGRATEERPPWGYARLLATRLPRVGSALDLDTGGGEVIAALPELPARMYVTEGWAPNVARARDLLGPRGVQVVQVEPGSPLPFPDGTFELVTSRHPVRPDWSEIARVLTTGGHYLAQHVGPASAFELIEYFLGPLPENRKGRDPRDAVTAAQDAGLTVTDLQEARCRMEFFDIGSVVYTLRKCVWWVPDFTVARYLGRLQELDRQIREHGPFVAYSSRFLIEARR
jgi:SAM-dependent methyltransferase